MSYEKFTLNEKKILLEKALQEVESGRLPVKTRFEDLILGCQVMRVPLTVDEAYAGRDLIFIWDTMKSPDELRYKEIEVSYSSPQYMLIKNEDLKKMIETELEEVVGDFQGKEIKESIADYSALFAFEERKALLVRNSYKPSRAIKIALTVKRNLYLPVIELKIIHNDREIRESSLRLKEKLEELNKAIPLVDLMEDMSYEELPESYLLELETFKHSKVKYVNGVRQDESNYIGKALLKQAEKEQWSAIELIEKFLFRVYETKIYTLKRKADNMTLRMFEKVILEYLAISPTGE